MSNELAPPRDMKVDAFAANAVIAARAHIHDAILNDRRGVMYKQMELEPVIFKDVKMIRDKEDNATISVSAIAKNGEIFLSATANSNERKLFVDQPLFASISLCTPSYREDEEFVYARCLTNGNVRVMDDYDHDIIHLLQGEDNQTYAIVNTSDPHSAYLQVVNVSKISMRQPLTHWPTRVLMHSINEQIGQMIKEQSSTDDERAATHQYLINKALTTGHVDTVAINPILILRNAGDFMKENFKDSKSKSLAVVIDKYTEELEALSEKYSDMWPRAASSSELNFN